MNEPALYTSRLIWVFGRCGYPTDVELAAACGQSNSSTVGYWRHGGRPTRRVLVNAFRNLAKRQPWVQDPVALAQWVREGGGPPAWLDLDDTKAPRLEAVAKQPASLDAQELARAKLVLERWRRAVALGEATTQETKAAAAAWERLERAFEVQLDGPAQTRTEILRIMRAKGRFVSTSDNLCRRVANNQGRIIKRDDRLNETTRPILPLPSTKTG